MGCIRRKQPLLPAPQQHGAPLYIFVATARGVLQRGLGRDPQIHVLAAPQKRRPHVRGSTAGSRSWRLNLVAAHPGNPRRGVGSAVPAGNARQAVAHGPTQGCAHTSIFVSRSQQGSCSTAQPYWDKTLAAKPLEETLNGNRAVGPGGTRCSPGPYPRSPPRWPVRGEHRVLLLLTTPGCNPSPFLRNHHAQPRHEPWCGRPGVPGASPPVAPRHVLRVPAGRGGLQQRPPEVPPSSAMRCRAGSLQHGPSA